MGRARWPPPSPSSSMQGLQRLLPTGNECSYGCRNPNYLYACFKLVTCWLPPLIWFCFCFSGLISACFLLFLVYDYTGTKEESFRMFRTTCVQSLLFPMADSIVWFRYITLITEGYRDSASLRKYKFIQWIVQWPTHSWARWLSTIFWLPSTTWGTTKKIPT